MRNVPPRLAGHPDRLRWNAKYEGGADAPAHPLLLRALELPPPDGPVLDLASGPSGSALAAAAAGRRVTAVDISEIALDRLAAEAARRNLAELITVVHADLGEWRPSPARFALVLCTGYWDADLFGPAAEAVLPDGGVLAWEAFTAAARPSRPQLPIEWCLKTGEPASLLPAGFSVLSQVNVLETGKRRLLARRSPT